jgi:hypothetical protein
MPTPTSAGLGGSPSPTQGGLRFDDGADGDRSIMLAYNLPRTEAIFERFGQRWMLSEKDEVTVWVEVAVIAHILAHRSRDLRIAAQCRNFDDDESSCGVRDRIDRESCYTSDNRLFR